MGLTEEEKKRVRAIWVPVSRHAEAVGVEVLTRLLAAHPTTKTYFHHLDLSPDSAQLRALGKKVVDALSRAVENLDDLPGALGKLSELHAFELQVSPTSFECLNHCILVTIGAHSRGTLDPALLLSLDKFLSSVAHVLTSCYR
ncbi:hemoglobin subunit alpha isoform X2 [Zootoca vivipara]|uniref:hemoglobin subunit alpha isoform X2 n=1 Tax=Zootoca vivipara TaxID=8524 RepID=UPI00159126F4|nr:hemoglobin subunit alpha isoform X2 [Zootoca vivipara]